MRKNALANVSSPWFFEKVTINRLYFYVVPEVGFDTLSFKFSVLLRQF